jgi:hypothetical protein
MSALFKRTEIPLKSSSCVVADAVRPNRSAQWNLQFTGNKQGNIIYNRYLERVLVDDFDVISDTCTLFPGAREQGINIAKTGQQQKRIRRRGCVQGTIRLPEKQERQWNRHGIIFGQTNGPCRTRSWDEEINAMSRFWPRRPRRVVRRRDGFRVLVDALSLALRISKTTGASAISSI